MDAFGVLDVLPSFRPLVYFTFYSSASRGRGRGKGAAGGGGAARPGIPVGQFGLLWPARSAGSRHRRGNPEASRFAPHSDLAGHLENSTVCSEAGATEATGARRGRPEILAPRLEAGCGLQCGSSPAERARESQGRLPARRARALVQRLPTLRAPARRHARYATAVTLPPITRLRTGTRLKTTPLRNFCPCAKVGWERESRRKHGGRLRCANCGLRPCARLAGTAK